MASERKKLVNKLDKVFSQYIRMRDGVCVVCGTKDNLQCGHLYSRIAYSTRWDEDNAFAQCRNCNMRHEYDFEPLRKYAEMKHGKKKLKKIYIKYKTPVKLSNNDLQDLIKYYQNKLKEVEK